jgi:hypothetical protein
MYAVIQNDFSNFSPITTLPPEIIPWMPQPRHPPKCSPVLFLQLETMSSSSSQSSKSLSVPCRAVLCAEDPLKVDFPIAKVPNFAVGNVSKFAVGHVAESSNSLLRDFVGLLVAFELAFKDKAVSTELRRLLREKEKDGAM